MTFAEALLILGLRDDSLDMPSIKRAYSRNLRETRPEDDPDGFMQLRAAYDLVRTAYRLQQQGEKQEQQVEQNHAEPALGETPLSATPDTNVAEPATDSLQNSVDTSPDYSDRRDINPYQSIADNHARKIETILQDAEARNDPDVWRGLIQPMREEALDDWIIFDAVLRQHLIEMYNAEIERRESEPESVAPPEPLIAPSLSIGIFKGMGWEDASQVDGPRYEQISWLEGQMRIYKTPKPKLRQPLPQPDPLQKLGFGPEIALGFVFVIIAIAIAFEYFQGLG